MIQEAMLEVVLVPAIQRILIQSYPQSRALRHGDDVVCLPKWTALNYISDLPTEKGLAGFMHPRHSCSHVQIGSRTDAGITTVAPESYAHGFTCTDETYSPIYAPQDCKIDHNVVRHA
jgi:hypothetical protein